MKQMFSDALGVLTGFAIGMAMFVGLASWAADKPVGAGIADTPNPVEAQEVRLLDKDGKTAGRIYVDGKGRIRLEATTARGKKTVDLTGLAERFGD